MLHTLSQFSRRRVVLVLLCSLGAGCAQFQPKAEITAPQGQNSPDVLPIPAAVIDSEAELIRRAEIERVHSLEREVERLKMDLLRAEDALIVVESKLRSGHSRAAVVSALAEAQLQLNKVSQIAPWRPDTISQAQDKLEMAQKHIDEEYFGAAVFFVYRANRIVEDLNYEANIVDSSTQVMFVNRPKVNLRSGASTQEEIIQVLVQGTPVVREKQKGDWVLIRTLAGAVGWIHRSLLTSKARYKA